MSTTLTDGKIPADFGLAPMQLESAFASQLQTETRQAAIACHAMYREMYGMETPGAVLAWTAIWTRDHGLTEAEAIVALRYVCQPDVITRLGNATALKNELARVATAQIQQREKLKRQLELRRSMEVDANPANQSAARDIIAETAKGFR